jgi:hypothetical protein
LFPGLPGRTQLGGACNQTHQLEGRRLHGN